VPPLGLDAAAAAVNVAGAQRRLPSGDLFRGAVEVEIVHREQVYRLRQTALGKLILTK
jgi:hemin uptake protein HemP